MKAKDVMTPEVATVFPETGVSHLIAIMRDRQISGLPVVDDDGRLVGIVTEGDLMRRCGLDAQGPARAHATRERRALEYVKSYGREVRDVMTSDVTTIDEELPVDVIAKIFDRKQINRVPVLRNGRIVGIVSRGDLLAATVMAGPDHIAPGDEAIRRAILARARTAGVIRLGSLDIAVANGFVELRGACASEAERAALLVIARGVDGVKGIADHSRVEQGAS